MRSSMKVSNCCGATFYEPGYPDNDICSCCSEHADAIDEEEPSIVVLEMPEIPPPETGTEEEE